MSTFAQRLRWCLKHGDMTVADLKHFFDRPYATVRMWVYDARRTPRGPAGNRAEQLLRSLEKKIKRGLVIPAEISSRERPAYLKKIRHDSSAGLSASHSAG